MSNPDLESALLVGIDIGTTSLKAVLFNAQGVALAEASQEYPTHFPHPNWAEQNAQDWWRATCYTLRQLFLDCSIGGDGQHAGERRRIATRVAAIGISCQAPSVVAVDRAGNALAPALIWMDRRTENECRWLHEHVGQEVIAHVNGGRIDPYYMAPKVLWLQRHLPDVYRATHQLLQANGYIIHQLCGAFTMDLSHGPLSLFFENANGNWSDLLLDAMQLDRNKLPPVFESSAVVGAVSKEAAALTGLAAGTPIVAGMTDGTAASIEAGLVQTGDAVEMTGQSTVLLICNDKPYLGTELIPLGHAIQGKHLVVGALVASGGALRWFRDQLGESERAEAAQRGCDAFDLLTAEAATSPAGASGVLFLPYMFGERSPIWDSYARGVFFGLTLATRKADLVRAILEGAAYGLRHNVDVAAQAGFPLATLACVGGGARSSLWNQIKADVLKRPVHLPPHAFGAPLGDVIVAAAGIGLYPSIEAAVAKMVVRGSQFLPQSELASRYDALYALYTDLYPALKQSFRALSQVPLGEGPVGEDAVGNILH
jgi:xylulokinase